MFLKRIVLFYTIKHEHGTKEYIVSELTSILAILLGVIVSFLTCCFSLMSPFIYSCGRFDMCADSDIKLLANILYDPGIKQLFHFVVFPLFASLLLYAIYVPVAFALRQQDLSVKTNV